MKQCILSIFLWLFSWLTALAQNVAVDPAFGVNGISILGIYSGIGQGDCLAQQPDGSFIVVGGTLSNQMVLRRVFENGKEDPAFKLSVQNNSPLTISQSSLLILQNGKIICTDGIENMYRFLSNGQLDTTFGIQGKKMIPSGRITKLYELPDGRILASGYLIPPDIQKGIRIFRLDTNGDPDPSFSEDGIFTYLYGTTCFSFDMNIQADGKYLLGGCALDPRTKNLIVRIDNEGNPDSTFGVNGFVYHDFFNDSEGFCMDLQPDGKVVLGGYTDDFVSRKGAVTRCLANGELDTDFGVNGTIWFQNLATIVDIKVLDNHKIMALGFRELGAGSIPAFVRLLQNGVPDSTFGTNGFFEAPGSFASFSAGLEQTGSHEFVAYLKSYSQGLVLFKIISDLSVTTITPQSDLSTLLYPNPIAESCTVKFMLEKPATVSVHLMDIHGRLLEKLVDQELFQSGEQEKALRLPKRLSAGSYQLLISIDEKPVKTLHIIKS